MNCKLLLTLLLFSTSCTAISHRLHKDAVESNSRHLRELTTLIDNNDHKSLLSKLKINNQNYANGLESLGFGFFIQKDLRCLNSEICFHTEVLKFHDSIISVAVTPSFFRVRPVVAGSYKRVLKKAGWQYIRQLQEFNSKILGFQSSTLQIPDSNFNYQPVPNPKLDSLMSAHTTASFDKVKESLSEKDLLYLLHSNNRWTRVQVLRYIKCNAIKTSSQTTEWIDYLIDNSPRLPTSYTRCLSGYEPVGYFLNCDLNAKLLFR